MLILQHSIPISSLPPSLSMSNFALEDRNPSSTIPIMLFFGFPIWSYPIQPYATSTGCTKSYAKTTQSNLVSYYTHIVKPYMGHTHIHQIPEALRVGSYSKSDNMVNSNSIFNTKYAEFSTEWYAHYYIQPPT